MIEINLTSARDELAARGFDGLTPTRANGFLNAGKNSLEAFAPWPWLETSTSGSPPLTISDLKTVLYVYNTVTNRPLEGQDRSYLREMYGPDLTTSSAFAYFWYLEGLSTLKVFPTETTNINVDYLMISPELVGDDDEPLFPARLDQIWIDLSCVEAYNDADEYTASQTLQAKAEARLSRELDTYFDRNHQNAQLQPITFASQDW